MAIDVPTDVAQLLAQADRLRRDGAEADAVLAYQQVLTLAPGLSAARTALWDMFRRSGEIHLQAMRLEEAAFFGHLALTLAPEDVETAQLVASIRFRLGVARFNDGDHAAAETLLRQSLQLRPDGADVRATLAHVLGARSLVLADQGQLDEAILLLREAQALNPQMELLTYNMFRLLVNKAIILYNNNLFSEAIVVAKEGLDMCPDSEWAQFIFSKVNHQARKSWVSNEDEPMVIPYLEMDITYACNLHCDGCTHYSDYSVKGHVDFATGSAWLRRWSERITPKLFRMVGGEPTLNPQLIDYIRFAHQLWPQAIREVVSNGFFLDRHPGLFETLAATNTALQISVHEESVEYLNKVRLGKLTEASRTYGFSFNAHYGTEQDFYRLYQGKAAGMRPFNDQDPASSMEACGNAGCTTLHLGRLWKCPPIAFLNNIEQKFGLAGIAEWQPYLQHKGLSVDASDVEIGAYVRSPQYFCAMCPAKRQGGSERTAYPL